MEQVTDVKSGKPTKESGPQVRAERKPFGSIEQKLAYPPREGFHRHWFNDVAGRIDRAAQAGYTHVKDREGKNVSKVVGTAEGGGALSALLMEIPEEFYKADMEAQQEQRDRTMAQIKAGKLEEKEGDNRYIPSQGIKITAGR